MRVAEQAFDSFELLERFFRGGESQFRMGFTHGPNGFRSQGHGLTRSGKKLFLSFPRGLAFKYLKHLTLGLHIERLLELRLLPEESLSLRKDRKRQRSFFDLLFKLRKFLQKPHGRDAPLSRCFTVVKIADCVLKERRVAKIRKETPTLDL